MTIYVQCPVCLLWYETGSGEHLLGCPNCAYRITYYAPSDFADMAQKLNTILEKLEKIERKLK